MKHVALIFAGGTGKRMHGYSRPKQFLECNNKPILAYTIEKFNCHEYIDGIVLVVLEDWIDYCWELVEKYGLTKVRAIVKGGETAFISQRNGLNKIFELFGTETIVLLHDGVRPLIDTDTITKCVESVCEFGTAVTVAPATETITIKDETGKIGQIIERSKVDLARAPQCFYISDILEGHRRAEKENVEFLDSAMMMHHYGYKLYPVEGPPENIKITTINDYWMFCGLIGSSDEEN